MNISRFRTFRTGREGSRDLRQILRYHIFYQKVPGFYHE